MSPDVLEQLLAEHQITRVLATYARAVDRRDWELLRTVFHPDAEDDHGPYVGDVDGLVAFLTEEMAATDSTTHTLGQVLVTHLDADTASVESHATAVHRHTRRDGSLVDLTFWVRYLDRFTRRDGTWRIARRTVVVDRSRSDPVVGGAALAASFTNGVAGPSDPSYG